MNKLIATGVVSDADDVKIVASVYVGLDEDGAEATAAKSHYVVMSYKNLDADALPTDAVTFASLTAPAKEGDDPVALKVPGFDGHADVTIAAPVEVKYAKTRAFVNFDGKNQIHAAFRYIY